jgi:hypothetical protein
VFLRATAGFTQQCVFSLHLARRRADPLLKHLATPPTIRYHPRIGTDSRSSLPLPLGEGRGEGRLQ